MNISITPGTYVVAVSGGVDSVSLLHALTSQHLPSSRFVVAHLDHGIRSDSYYDRKFVEELARSYRLSFVAKDAHLGAGASEDEARSARYQFLRQVKTASGARAVVTAHHQDDLIETAIFNLLRGTGRKGLSPLSPRGDIQRPLIHMSKVAIIDYANAHNLAWREDSTNSDARYARNRIRSTIMPKLNSLQRDQLLQCIHSSRDINDRLDAQLIHHLHIHPARDRLDRRLFAQLPHAVSREILATWLRSHGLRDFDKKALERLSVAIKVAQKGATIDVFSGKKLTVTDDSHVVLS